MSRRRTASLLALTAIAATPLTAPAPASAQLECPSPDDRVVLGWTLPHTPLRDELAISPDDTTFALAHDARFCASELTVQRPDGSGSHQVALHEFIDYIDTGMIYYGDETVDYVTGTGPWRITKVTTGDRTVDLTTPVDFRIRRTSEISLAVIPGTLPKRPRATGIVRYWTSQGTLAPAPVRRVTIHRPAWDQSGSRVPGPLIATTITDGAGRYAVDLPVGSTQAVMANVDRATTLGFAFTQLVTATVYQPTSISGYAAPTTATVIRPGTKMSTYGHLKVVYTTGRTGPFANQKVVVQTRPRSNPSIGYSTVATATTRSTGYYYANWNASVDVDVRVAYPSPYRYITSSFRWLRLVDVR